MIGLIQCVSAFFACIGFAFIFRLQKNWNFIIIGSLGGMLGWLFFLLANSVYSEIIAYVLAMSGVAFYSEIMARVFKAPATIFVIIGCFPLVPGNGIYQTMLYCINGNIDMFISSLLNTLAISGSLAFAILLVSTIFKIFKVIQNNLYRERKL